MDNERIEQMDVLKLIADFDRDHPGLLEDFFAAIRNDPGKVLADIREAAKTMELDQKA